MPNSSEISNFLTLGLQDAKICFSDDTLPDGFSVRKGDMVSYQPYAMGRMRFVWGDDAEEFRPERWLNEKGLFCPESPFKFTAFQVRLYIPLFHACFKLTFTAYKFTLLFNISPWKMYQGKDLFQV